MAIRKSYSNLKIAFPYNVIIDVSYDIQESWSFISMIRTVSVQSVLVPCFQWSLTFTKKCYPPIDMLSSRL